jgi:hypothetical protein
MATPTIPNGEEYFFPIIYEGNGAGQRVGKFVPFTDNGTIANSVLFNRPDSPNLSRTYGSAGTSQKKFTFSCWVKKSDTNSNWYNLFNVGDVSGSYFNLGFNSGGGHPIQVYDWTGSTYRLRRITNRTFEDASKWYHIVLAIDTTQATASDRVKLYVDGDEVTSFSTSVDPSLNLDTLVGSADNYNVGSMTSNYLNGYLAEVNYIDGQALGPETFGVTDTSTGRWIPKTLTGITYGTNGFRLKFQDSSALGDDTSGNTNDFTATNLASTDQTTDSPTQNHATIDVNTASNGSMTFAEGNLKVSMNGAYPGNVLGTLGARSGKYYWEVTLSGTGSSANGYATGVGVAEWSKLNSDPGGVSTPFSSFIDSRSIFVHNGATVSNSTTFTAGDVISIALNLDDSEISYFKNNTIVGSAQPLVEGQAYFPLFKNSTGVANLEYSPNFGQKSWNYTPPTGFVALQQDNLPETAKGITGFTWIKDRDNALNHNTYDSSSGVFNRLVPNATSAILNTQGGVSKFLKGGIVVGDTSNVNNSGASMVSWNWVANSGTTSTNTDGSFTSTVQANTTAGFSIVQFTPGSSAGTVGHGLSQAPEWIIMKDTSRSVLWLIYHKDVGADKYLQFTNAAPTSNSTVFSTEPTATTFDPGTGYTSGSSYGATVTYCWHSVDGFSKFGKYVGNGNADGPFVYTGFKPVWVLFKSNNTANWYLHDSTRSPNNPIEDLLYPNLALAENNNSVNGGVDFLSNGFKIRQPTGYGYNYSGTDTYYMAFAEHPFVGDGTSPVTAR